MSKQTYWQKLKDPRWQKMRLNVLSKNDFHCEICGNGESTLHVHHKEYIKGREPWEYEISQLSAICDECHGFIHDTEDPLKTACSFLPLDGPNSRDFFSLLISGAIQLPINNSESEYRKRIYATGCLLDFIVSNFRLLQIKYPNGDIEKLTDAYLATDIKE